MTHFVVKKFTNNHVIYSTECVIGEFRSNILTGKLSERDPRVPKLVTLFVVPCLSAHIGPGDRGVDTVHTHLKTWNSRHVEAT